MKTPINQMKVHGTNGFTLIEMLLVLVILGILAGIVVPSYSSHPTRVRITATVMQITSFKTALASFEMDNGYFPRGRDGLQSLLVRPGDAPGWKGPYIPEIPLDPWQHAYLYESPGQHNPTAFDIVSMGPDGKLGGDDDISNWPAQTK